MSTNMSIYLDYRDPKTKQSYCLNPAYFFLYPSPQKITDIQSIAPTYCININPNTIKEDLTNQGQIKMTRTYSKNLSKQVKAIYEELSDEVIGKPDFLPLFKINVYELLNYLRTQACQNPLIRNIATNVYKQIRRPLALTNDSYNDLFTNPNHVKLLQHCYLIIFFDCLNSEIR